MTTRGVLRRVDGAGQVAFTFNPSTMTVHKTAKYRATPGPNHILSPPRHFLGVHARRLTLQVLFDAWVPSALTVAGSVDTLLSWTCPTPESVRAKTPQPPLVTLDWGGVPAALAWCVSDVKATYLLFDEQGVPLRATVDLVLEETPDEVRPQNPTSGGEPGTRSRPVVGGDSLASVAAQEYGDPGAWRALAAANGIDDPMRLPTGTPLLVPPPARVRSGAGRG